MKEYLRQFYNEGFATIFYQKPVNYLKKKIKSEKIVKLLSVLIKLLYTILVLMFAGYVLYKKLS